MSDQPHTVLAAPRQGRLYALAVLLACAAILVLLAIVLWGTGSDETAPQSRSLDDSTEFVAASDTDQNETPTSPEDALTLDPAIEDLEVTHEVFLSRDPFSPVVPEEPEAIAPADPATPTTPGTPVPGTPAPGTPAPGTPTSPTTPTSGQDRCTGDHEVVCDGRVITLVDIVTASDGTLAAVVQVDTARYEVREGEVFAGFFVLLDVTSTTATVAYVDETFVLRVGNTVLK